MNARRKTSRRLQSTGRSGRQTAEEYRPGRAGLLARIQVGEAFTLRRLAVMLGLVVLALLPAIWGPRLVPYRLGQVLRHPLYARVDFTWENEAEAARRREQIEEKFPRYYKEDADWAIELFEPVHLVLNKAHNLAIEESIPLPQATEQLAAYAEEQRLRLSPEEARVVLTELRSKAGRISFYWELIDPVKDLLARESFTAGILSGEDYRRELYRQIRVVYGRGLVRAPEPVGSSDGPVSVEGAAQLVRTYFEAKYGRFDLAFRRVFAAVMTRRLRPTLTFAPERTRAALAAAVAAANEEAGQVEAGDELMPAGRPIQAADLERIRQEAAAFEASQGALAPATRLLGTGALLFTAAVGFLFYLVRFERGVFLHARRLVGVLLIGLVVLWVLQIGMMLGWPVTLVPVGLVAGVAALIFGPRAGVGTASLLAFAAFVMTETDVGEIISLLGSSWVFCCLAPGVRHRSGLLRAGALAGAVSFLGTSFWRFASGTVFGFLATKGSAWGFAVWMGAYDGLAWIAGAVLLTVALPLVEQAFGAATNITLLELSDQEHPCLRKLVLEAPGSYHHSVIVGNLSESAAEAIGANPLKTRVASYYHDIGKIPKPEYFTENDAGRSRHDDLAPTVSALIIVSHVKDGVEMGRAYNLPQDILDIIEQHHGDSVVTFFYHRAREQAEDPSLVSEGAFRYPGPKPQTAEAALVLLADCVEAASRSLSEPTPHHIGEMVHRVVMGRLTEGQLDESPLTFRDVSAVEKSFVRTLNAMFHARVRYPGASGTARRGSA